MDGSVAVVVGAGSGLGRDIARALADRGARVVLAGRTASRLEETRAALNGETLVVPIDICQRDDVELLRAETTAWVGAASILVNTAGIFGPLKTIVDSDPQEWIATLQANCVGPYLTCRAFAPGMVAAGWGRIVNVSSAAPLYPPGAVNSAYATSKAALNQLTRHLAAELDGTGVTANVMHPGSLKTDMWADIKRQVTDAGEAGAALREWVEMVDQTGGDSTDPAVKLVLELVGDAGAETTGQFCWPSGIVEQPMPTW